MALTQRNVPGVRTMVGPIEDSLREAFFLALFGGQEVRSNLREILGHSVKHGGLGITNHLLSAECVYNNSKAASKVLVGSILVGTDLNYVAHTGCRRIASTDERK